MKLFEIWTSGSEGDVVYAHGWTMEDGQKSITIAHLSRRQDKTFKSMYANQVKYGSIILCTKVCFCEIPSHNDCWSPTFLKQF